MIDNPVLLGMDVTGMFPLLVLHIDSFCSLSLSLHLLHQVIHIENKQHLSLAKPVLSELVGRHSKAVAENCGEQVRCCFKELCFEHELDLKVNFAIFKVLGEAFGGSEHQMSQ